MSQLLPPLFIGIAALALMLGLLALWQSLRVLLLAEPGAGDVSASPDARLALVDEKATLLKAIKELEQERDFGKISEHDYEAFNARYRARAREVLRALDGQLGDYRKQAEALVEKELAKASTSATARQEPVPEQAASGDDVQSSRLRCAACQADNEVDAAFCKKCGKPISTEPSAEDADAGGAA